MDETKLLHRISRNRCFGAMISAFLVAACVGVTMHLTALYEGNFDYMGLRTFCLFTVNSTILGGIGMMALPFTKEAAQSGTTEKREG